MSEERFNKTLKKHKKLIAEMFKTKDKLLMIPIEKTARELSLAYAECRCEKCKKEQDLQYHHLIPKQAKPFMDIWRYMSQRHYWGNIIILCHECHKEIENRTNQNYTNVISTKMIDKVKRKYCMEDE